MGIYEALGQTLVSELHSKDDQDIYVVLYNTQGTEDININENVLRSFKPENFETDCLSVGKGGDADLNNNINGGNVEKVSNDSFAAKEIEALLANAKDQEQQILQKDQKIVLLERKIEALICENRNIAAVADEKDEKAKAKHTSCKEEFNRPSMPGNNQENSFGSYNDSETSNCQRKLEQEFNKKFTKKR